MENQNQEQPTWGGARKGAGRKKTRGKTVFFQPTFEVEAALLRLAGTPGFKRGDFLNEALTAYMTEKGLM